MNRKERKIQQLCKQIPELKQIPEHDRLNVFNQAFKTVGYRLFLTLVILLFVLVFYFNLDNILDYKGLDHGGMVARNVHFLKELGYRFFLPLMVVFGVLVLGRNYFIIREVKKYKKF